MNRCVRSFAFADYADKVECRAAYDAMQDFEHDGATLIVQYGRQQTKKITMAKRKAAATGEAGGGGQLGLGAIETADEGCLLIGTDDHSVLIFYALSGYAGDIKLLQ